MIHRVGVADMKVSTQKGDLILTHALGSCLGVAVYDPLVSVGGLLHVMLPLSTIDPEKANRNPLMFVDTGLPKLFTECFKNGAQKQRMEIRVAGGADSYDGGLFQIGRRNFIILRQLLWKNGLLMRSYDVGGSNSRTMSLEIGTGKVTVRSNRQMKNL